MKNILYFQTILRIYGTNFLPKIKTKKKKKCNFDFMVKRKKKEAYGHKINK